MTDGSDENHLPSKPDSGAILPFRTPDRIEGPGSEERLKTLRKKFHATGVGKRRENARWLRSPYVRCVAVFALIVAAIAIAYLPDLGRNTEKFGSQDVAWRHMLASQNCDAARQVGLANARVGQPGYYPQHDADNDGIACEPYPRWR